MTRPTHILAFFAAVFTIGLQLPGTAPGIGVRLAVVFFLFVLTLFLHLKRILSTRSVTVCLFLLWLSLGWVRAWQPVPAFPDEEVWIEGRVRIPVEQKESGTRIRLLVDRWYAGETSGPMHIGAVANLDHVHNIHAGERIRLIGLMLPLETARNPGGFNEQAYWAMRGVQVRIIKEKSIQKLGVKGFAGHLDRIFDSAREAVDNQIRHGLDARAVPLAQALLIGDRSGWNDPTRDQLARSGLMHLFAISGLHVGLLWAILASLLALIRIPKGFRTLMLLLVLWFYAAFTGANPPVLRASVIITIYSVGNLLQRQHRIGYTMALAWIGLLAWRPHTLGDAGFQLTFAGAVGSIWTGALFRDWIRIQSGVVHRRAVRWLGRALRWTAYALMISLGATIATTPFVIAHFGRLPWCGPLVTVAAVPILTGILITGWGMVFFGWVPVIGKLFGDALWVQLHILDLIAGTSSRALPVSEQLPLSSAVIAGMVFLLLVLWAPRLRMLGIRGVLIALLVLSTGIVWADAWLPEGRVKAGVLDVGQGDAILVRRGEHAFLVDSGSGKLHVARNQMRLTGVRQLELLVITHGDKDHAGGAAEIVREFPVKMGLIGPGSTRDKAGREAVEEMLKKGIPVYVGREGGTVDLGKLGNLSLFWPTDSFTHDPRKNDNDLSLIFCWRTGEASALFPGDAGEQVERILVKGGHLPDVDLLVAGHHGSRYSTTSAWLGALHPELVVISAGRNNPYGHPAPEVLQRISEFGISVHRTDREGAILLTPSTDGFRSLSRREWW
ncbi:MAG: DNA internalization-related competence protein ComEC/Rec2 [bacterium]